MFPSKILDINLYKSFTQKSYTNENFDDHRKTVSLSVIEVTRKPNGFNFHIMGYFISVVNVTNKWLVCIWKLAIHLTTQGDTWYMGPDTWTNLYLTRVIFVETTQHSE